MQAVKYLLLVLLFAIYTTSCSSKKSFITINNYEVIAYKSKENSTYIVLKAFSYEMKNEVPSYYRVNNILMGIKDPDEKLVVAVMPGKFTIEAGSIGKKETIIEDLKVNRGDSVLVNIFLKDDPQPLVD